MQKKKTEDCGMIRFILSNFIRGVDEKAASLVREKNRIKVFHLEERIQNCKTFVSAQRFSISELFLRLGNNGILKDMGASL